ncbi:DUF1217 domain-containing protein [soil metagenome]
MLSTAASYRLISSDMTRSLDMAAKEPVAAREIAYYRENITKVKSIDDFMKNDRLFRFAMKANGLEDMTYAKAFIRKMLTEGIDDEDAFANKLSDTRYKDLVSTFNFKRYGETTTVFTAVQEGTVDKYVRQSMEEKAGNANEGVRLALYFERKAPALTDTYGILGDKAMLQVVQTALGLSPMTGLADIDKQAAMIGAKLDIEDLKDPEKLKAFLTRFTSMWEAQNPSSGGTLSAASILIGQPVEMGISTNLLMSLQGLKLGGN